MFSLRGAGLLAFFAGGLICSQAETLLVPWGDNYYGQTNIPPSLTNVVSIAGSGSHNLALRADGRVAAWGWNSYGQATVPPGLSNVAAIAAGGSHNLALLSNGMVVSWGWNFYGQTNVPAGLADVVAIAGGGSHSLALRRNGTVAAWGNNDYGQRMIPFGLENVMAVAAGGWHSLALKPNGTVVGWGYNGYGQAEAPADLTNVVAIAAGACHSVALKADGTVSVWGNNDYGQADVPANLSNVVAIASGVYHVLALKADGTVAAWGYNFSGQTNVPAGLTGVVAIAERSLALVGDGPPFLTTLLLNRTAVIGHPVQFRIGATGLWPLTYQWRRYGINLPDATNAVLFLPDAQETLAGPYSVVVRNGLGETFSQEAVLSLAGLLITSQPQDVTTWRSGMAGYQASVESALPVSYQWRFGGADLHDDERISGANTANLVISDLELSDSGEYTLFVSNALATATSAVARLTVTNRPPILTCQPTNRVVDAWANASFTVCVTSPYPYTVQWLHDGNLLGATSNTLLLTNVWIDHQGSYWCVVSNQDGAVTSASASLTVIVHPPEILSGPTDQTVSVGNIVTFTVQVSGSPPFYFQWLHNGQDIPGATTNRFRIQSAAPTDLGYYQVVITNFSGSVTSQPALLVVLGADTNQLVAWGDNYQNQTNVPPGLTNVVAISAGGYHGLALKADSTVAAWGGNEFGQINVPPGLSNVVAIAAGAYDSIALKTDGTLVGWGTYSNSLEMPVAVPAGLSNVVQIAAGGAHILALRNNGMVTGMGYYCYNLTNYQPITVPSSATNLMAVAAGYDHSLALRSDGAVLAWGDNYYGQTAVPPGLSNVVAIAAGSWHNLALKAEGTVVGWGNNDYGQINVPDDLTNAVAIAAGSQQSLALLSDGRLRAWGTELQGQTNALAISNIVAIAAGHRFNLALRGNGGPYLVFPFPNQSAPVGATVEFRPLVGGLKPFTFLWQFNRTNIVGATNAVLVLTNVQSGTNGYFTVLVTDALGRTSRFGAHLEVVPMVFSELPKSQLVYRGEAMRFSVGVASTVPVSYQWRFQGTDLADDSRISGANTPVLSIQNVQDSDAGGYSVMVSNAYGSRTTLPVVLTVTNHLPVFTCEGPWGQTVNAGWNVTFYVCVASDFPYTLQWQHDRQDIPGETNLNLRLYNVGTNDAGKYRCLASNREGVVTSEEANLNVQLASPQILGGTLDQSINMGEPFNFWILASGSAPLFYQWQHNEVDIPGATTNYWYLPAVSTNDAGRYRLIITNAVGAVTSSVITLTVITRAPGVTRDPTNIVADAGRDVCFNAEVVGAPRPFVQWQFNDVDIPGANNPTLCLSSISSNNAGLYWLLVSNVFGVVTSAPATLEVVYRAPEFILSPTSQTVAAGSNASFSCMAVAGPKPTLQWLFNGQPIPGATTTSLVFVVTTTNQAGAYSVQASNYLGSALSEVATLTVSVTPPGFGIFPCDQGAVAGNPVRFSAGEFSGSPALLQWQWNQQDIPGATNPVFSIPHVQTNDAGEYRLIVSNEAGTTSAVARLVVALPGPLDHWEWRRPLPQGNDLHYLAYGNGAFVAVGEVGAKIRSTDKGLTWQEFNQGDAEMTGLAYGNGLFVATGLGWGDDRYLATSPDGATWTEKIPQYNEDGWIRQLTFGNGRFVGVNEFGKLLVSTNGIDWAENQTGSSNTFSKLRFTGNQFAGLGYTNLGQNGLQATLALSSNGLDWTVLPITWPGTLYDVAYGNDKFVISGALLTNGSWQAFALVSPDAITWQTSAIPGLGVSLLAFGNGRFVAMSEETPEVSAVSVDGMTWILQSTGTSTPVYALTSSGGRFVAAGENGLVLVSTDGANWTARSPGTPWHLQSIARGKDLYVAVGNGRTLLVSSNGLVWSRQAVSVSVPLRCVVYANKRFVAVGDAANNGAVFLNSINGRDWSTGEMGVMANFYNLTYGKGLFVAVGFSGAIATSPDGQAWAVRNSGTILRLNAITWNGSLFVAVGQYGIILTSPNATDWVIRASGGADSLEGVAFGNGRFVAVGETGAFLCSTNGLDWTRKSWRQSPFASRNMAEVQFVNGHFIAVGSGGYLASSPDADLWTPHLTGCQHELRSMCHAEGYVSAVGNNETILQSDFWGPPILRIRSFSMQEGLEFSVDAEVGPTYRLQASDDLVNWDDIFTFSNRYVTTLFLDPEAGIHPRRFYRVTR